MFSYRAFGLGIQSQVPLPDLPGSQQPPDVVIRQRRMSAASLADMHDGGDSIGGIIAGGSFRFLIERGREVWFDHDEDFLGRDMIPSILLGMVLAAVLRQRGLLVLHASCVARDGEAVGFVGDSGSGKSTLAEYFCQRGYTLLSDDLLAAKLEDRAPVVIPGFPQVKLLPDAGSFLRNDYGQLRELPGEAGKRTHSQNNYSGGAAYPLKGLFVLSGEVEEVTKVVDLPGHLALMELSRHTRMHHMFTAADYQRRQLEQCSELIRKVPIRQLRRARTLEGLPEIFAKVDDFVGAPEKATSNG